MKKILLSVVLALGIMNANAQDNPKITTMDLTAAELAHYMAPGWNLGNTLEAGSNANNFTNNGGLSSETSWQSTKTTQEIIDLVKTNGFKSVRIPTSWVMGHITDKDNMTIDPGWMARVKQVVDYCISANLYVVLNDHWDGGWLEYDGFTTGADVDAKKEQLRKLWTNIANEFKDYDERLIFAGLNEPGVGGASPEASGSLIFNQYGSDDESNLGTFVSRLYEYEQVFIDAVRATGGNNAKRVLVVQGPSVNAARTYNCFDMTKLTDSATGRLMLEVHHYDPYQFCGMESDQSWGKVWYYWYGHEPKRASSDRIAPQSQQTNIQTNMNHLKTKFVDNGYPVIIGEYGCNNRNLAPTVGNQAYHAESVQYWYNFSTEYAYEAGLIPFTWDTNYTNYPSMTIFDRNGLKVFDQYILDGIKEGDTAGRSAFNAIYPDPSSADGIESAKATTATTNAAIYNLQGMAVGKDKSKLDKGLYIQGGGKFVVK